MMIQRFDAVVVSDLHLGARNARTEDFLRFLDKLQTKRLIVNGDLFDDERLRSLRPCDIRLIEALRQYARVSEVEWLRGNHDPPEDWFNGLLGLQPLEETILDVYGAKYLVYHGHGFDRSMNLPNVVIATADAIYAGCQWIDPSHRLARVLKRKSKMFCRSVEQLRRRAIQMAHDRDLAGVILGHTHVAADAWFEGKHYLNSGCWTEKPCGFIGVRHGRAMHYTWNDGIVQPLEVQHDETQQSLPDSQHDRAIDWEYDGDLAVT